MVNPVKYVYYNMLPIKLLTYINTHRDPRRKIKNVYRDKYCDTKSIFIHIPKTAGTSVSEAIYGFQPWHHLARSFHQMDAQKFDEYFSFAFVRNPWDRLYSAYNYACKISHPVYRGPLSDVAKYASFEAFVMDWFEHNNVDTHYFLQPQFNFVTLDDKKIAIDFIGRFENVNDDFQYICEQLNLDLSLPELNKARVRNDYRTKYSPLMVDRIASLYRKDIDAFNYDFE